MSKADDLFAVVSEAFAAPVALFEHDRCPAKDRNAKCVRVTGHEGWHRSLTGVAWPNRNEAKL